MPGAKKRNIRRLMYVKMSLNRMQDTLAAVGGVYETEHHEVYETAAAIVRGMESIKEAICILETLINS